MTDSATSKEPTRGAKVPARRWWLIGGSIAAAAAIGVAFWAGSSTQPTIPAAQDSSEAAVVGSVAAGSGGTKTAVDGVTTIGYESSCTGAVQAASNYDATVNLYKPASDQDFVRLVHQVFVSPQAAEPFLKNSAEKVQIFASREVQQAMGGAYKVESCTPGQSASVLLYSCAVKRAADPRYATGDCGTIRVGLAWSAGDWKATSLGMPDSVYGLPKDFRDAVKDEPADPSGITAAQWAKITAPDETGPITGWVDFSNAHR